MLKNYFQIAIRNLKRDKVFSFINIAGLAVGITCFITLSLYIIYEFGYDRYNKNADRIYRVYVHSNINNIESNNSKTAAPLGAELSREFPEVINYTRIGYFGSYNLRYKDKIFKEWEIYAADSTYFDVFTLPFIYGNPKNALVHPNSIVLTEEMSKKYFGDEDPVGKSFIVDDKGSYLITGVMKDFPKNSHFRCRFLISMSTYPISQSNYWLNLWYSTYIVLKKGTDPHAFDDKMKNVVLNEVAPQAEAVLGVPLKDFFNKGNSYGFYLQPLTSIHLYSQRDYGIDLNTEWSNIDSSDIAYVYIFSAVALFILLIAIINFMNLATARSEKRSKEVGIRKTLGSGKSKLIIQFITESIFMSLLAVFLSIVMIETILPVFGKFVGRDLKLDFFNNIYTIPLIILFVLLVGTLAGSYPAFYLSSFQPSHILKPNSGRRGKKHLLRNTLVIIQFSISITLIIGTMIIKNQLDYIQNKNLGFNKEHLVSINNADALTNKLDAFKNELLKNPDISSVTKSSVMFQSGVPGNGYLYNKQTGTDVISFQYLDVDYDFLKTYGIKLKAGRYFSKAFPSDTSAVLINEAGAKECTAENPIGKTLKQIGINGEDRTYTIIGVIKDFNYESLHQKVRPLVLCLNKVRQPGSVLTVKVASLNFKQTIHYIEETWNKLTNNQRFSYNFVDQKLAQLYESEEKTGNITTVFSSLALFIACLGLFGLAAFITEQRTKEIGIRKVVGASILEIVMNLSKEFTKWVVLANLIAWPVAYYIMNNWLKNFAYSVNLDLSVFVLAGIIALIIALTTISFQTIKAARANPVESLKYE
jgi:putative ABC transport system permease protein